MSNQHIRVYPKYRSSSIIFIIEPAKIIINKTSFAQQFKKLVGNTPMEYLTEWRMSLAYSKLQLSTQPMLSIALDIGYQSEAAFSRAFKKLIGQSPNQIRKAYQNPAISAVKDKLEKR